MMSTLGDVNLLTNPLRPLDSYSRTGDAIESEKDRKLPYDASKFVAQQTTRTRVRIKLPVAGPRLYRSRRGATGVPGAQ